MKSGSGLNFDGVHLAVQRYVEDLLSVPAPHNTVAARRGDLPFAALSREADHVNLGARRLIGRVCQPTSVWGKLGEKFGEDRLQVWKGLAVSKHRQHPNVVAGLRILAAGHVQQVTAVA